MPAVTDAIAGLYKNKYHIWRGDKQNPHVDVVGEVLQKINDIYGGGIHRSHTDMYFALTLFPFLTTLYCNFISPYVIIKQGI